GPGAPVRQGGGDGEALHRRALEPRRQRRAPAPRRLRLHGRVPDLTALPRPEDPRDRRGHERDPANGDRQASGPLAPPGRLGPVSDTLRVPSGHLALLDDRAFTELDRAAADRIDRVADVEEREGVPRDERRRALPPALLHRVVDLVRALMDGMDLVADDRRAQELHRLRERRARTPPPRPRVEDPALAKLPLSPPAADHPDLPAEDDRAEGVHRPRQLRRRTPPPTLEDVDVAQLRALGVIAAEDVDPTVDGDRGVVVEDPRQPRAVAPASRRGVVHEHLPPSPRRRRPADDV